jgi:preprotein translocase subunit SecA
MVTSAISRAQKRVEAHNFDIRKHLLEYDNVMNKQREEIYRQRNAALMSEDISERVREDILDVVAERVQRATGEKVHRDEWNFRGLADELSYVLTSPVDPAELQGQQVEEVMAKAEAIGERAYRAREAEFGAETTRELERHLYLFTIDEHWRDHLHELDHLKGGIGLRAYGQRDPLVEYKKEAFSLFETLLGEVREEFVQRFFRVQLQPQAVQEVLETQPRAPRHMVAQHAEAEAFGGTVGAADEDAAPQPARGQSARPQPAAAQPPRPALRAGRNDPCPCGSGKKYKKCHMPTDERVGSGT